VKFFRCNFLCRKISAKLLCVVCSDGNLFEFVIVSLENKQWHFTAQSAEVRWLCSGNYGSVNNNI